MSFLDNMGDSGVLQNYTRANFNCPDYATLMEHTLQAAHHLGLECNIQFRYSGGTLSSTPNGQAGPLEESVLTQVAGMGRLFQFKKRLVTNFEHVTIIIVNMPENADHAGRSRDNIAILAEIADEFVVGIAKRKEFALNLEFIRNANLAASAAVDILRKKYHDQQVATRLLQNELIGKIEQTYIELGLTESQEQTISHILKKNSDKILCLFEQSKEFDNQLSNILNALT